jgi:hypothetical protein
MHGNTENPNTPATERASFYTVTETAVLLRVDAATIYRAIREDVQ